MFLLYVISVGLEDKTKEVNYPTNTEESTGEEVDDTHTDLAFVELVSTDTTKEEPKEKCNPLVLGSANVSVYVSVGVGVGVVNNDLGSCPGLRQV